MVCVFTLEIECCGLRVGNAFVAGFGSLKGSVLPVAALSFNEEEFQRTPL